ncbi:hypothetical protein [Novosphingobium sp.]|uniref:hypothetical protein n=1 Tax=Novosphingobium sp. TaxID=1874826 RepID=UPI0025E4DEFE|nr:hypothetical protein [Novosphingobium sp.]MCC6924339.1 DUF11 domain-containing protein [Novosphingobium sp.]
MIKYGRLLGTVGAAALAVVGASPAFASGTAAGTVITNTVTVNYQVGGVNQTATGASNSFAVDRKVNMTVAEVGTTTTQVSPGQLAAVTTFTVTNNSNATLDFALAAAQQTGGAGAHSNTDTFDATNVKIYVDTNGNGTYDVGTDLEVAYLDELAADASKTVFVVADMPLGLATNDVAAVTLTATGREGGGTGSQGAALSETNTGITNEIDPNEVDTVFADAAGATDGAGDGAHSAKDDWTVLAAALSVTKLSKVVSDPVNGTSNPKAIPGATIEYCIVVANAAGSATASSVAISDPLPATVTYDGGGVFVDGSVTSGACNTDGSNTGSHAAGVVSGTISSVTAGETKTLRFRATIN